MVVKLFSELRNLTFSRLEAPKRPSDQHKVINNMIRVSIWGLLCTGSIAAISFIFSRYLIQKEPSRAIVSNIFSATFTSCAIYTAFASYLALKLMTPQMEKNLRFFIFLNRSIAVLETGSAIVGLFGAAAALTTQFLKIDRGMSGHLVYPLLGLGIAGLSLRLFHAYQNRLLTSWLSGDSSLSEDE
jgi:hypothetical protein